MARIQLDPMAQNNVFSPVQNSVEVNWPEAPMRYNLFTFVIPLGSHGRAKPIVKNSIHRWLARE